MNIIEVDIQQAFSLSSFADSNEWLTISVTFTISKKSELSYVVMYS